MKIDDYKLKNINFDKQTLSKMVTERDGVQKAYEISDEILEEYYQAALRILEAQRWEDAINAFQFLTFVNQNIFNFWFGLAFAEQSAKKYEAAIINYSMALLINEKNPEVNANIAQCLFAIGEKELAKEHLQTAIDKCSEKSESKELKMKLETWGKKEKIL